MPVFMTATRLLLSSSLPHLMEKLLLLLVDDSATVKRFYKENGHIRLQPENDFMEPIIVDSCEIIGKVIGLIRINID